MRLRSLVALLFRSPSFACLLVPAKACICTSAHPLEPPLIVRARLARSLSASLVGDDVDLARAPELRLLLPDGALRLVRRVELDDEGLPPIPIPAPVAVAVNARAFV